MGARAEAALWGLLAFLLFVPTRGHVPGYAAVDGCARLQHPPSVSQVAYAAVPVGATAGLEFHVRSDTSPVDTTDPNAVVDFDFTFRDKVDPTTFSIHVGCGGCALGDETPAARLEVDYKHGVVEPCAPRAHRRPPHRRPPRARRFTQTTYRSFQPGEPGDANKQFDASLLSLAACPAQHFVLLLRSFPNATEPIFVGFVIGRAERFTGEELRAMPEYILRNHGAAWSGQAWTAPVTLVAVVALIALAKAAVARSTPAAEVLDATGLIRFAYDPRELAYEVAMTAYAWAAVEVAVHFVYAAAQPDVRVEAFAVVATFGIVILFANVLPLVVTIVAWSGLYVDDRKTWWLRADVWAPIELICGIGWLHLLGSGFGLGPSATIVAALIRFRETEFLGRSLRSTAGVPPPRAAEGAEPVAAAA